MIQRLEIEHKSEPGSGYGTMVHQLADGLRAIGQPFEEREGGEIYDTLVHAPKRPVLRRVDTGGGAMRLRWVDADSGHRVQVGTRFRRWVTDHDLPASYYGFRDGLPAEPVTRPDVVRICPNTAEGARWDGAGMRVLMTMWESSELPEDIRPWAPHLRRADLVLVPCEHSRRLVLSVAPEVRCRVVPLALDPKRWPLLERQRLADSTYVFVLTGDLSKRKGIDLAYSAFREAFGPDDRAALVFKARGRSDFCAVDDTGRMTALLDESGAPVVNERGEAVQVWNRDRKRYRLDTKDPDVLTLRGDWSRRRLLELYRRADCFVWPSRGEGWGYPPREAAATGLPVITSTHTGMYDATRWAVRIVPHYEHVDRAYFQHWGPAGHWFLPDLRSLSEAMRWCYDNRAKAAALGRRASAYLQQRTPADLARDVLREIEEALHERDREDAIGAAWRAPARVDHGSCVAGRKRARVPARA